MKKPKIALIVDTDNWAFYNRAVFIKEKLSEFYDFKIIPATTALEDNILQVILLIQDCDLVHFFWRGLLFSLDENDVVFKRNNIDIERFKKEKFSNIVKTTCIPDHALLDEKYIEKTKEILNMVDDYYTMSKKLNDIYEKMDCRKPGSIIRGGVNNELFIPKNLARFDEKEIENRKIIIGWSGNSKWGDWDGNTGIDVKGVDTVLIPAIKELQEEGYNIELKLADRNIKFTPIEEMPQFYNSIDLYVCVSKEEGGPNTVLESMCCGVPVISTNVGFVQEVLGKEESNFIIQERSIENVKNAIKKLLNNKKIFKVLSEENIEESKKYGYNEIAKQFKEFFDRNLYKKVK